MEAKFTKAQIKKLEEAAPLMYEALRSIYDDREAFSDLFDSQQAKVKEALKKATE